LSKIIKDFGEEWQKFSYLDSRHNSFLKKQFAKYMLPIPKNRLSPDCTVAADFGAGSGRWSRELAELVKIVHAIEPSSSAFKVLEKALGDNPRVILHHSSIEAVALIPESLDFAMSLGVIHHLDNPQNAMNQIFRFLKCGGTFLGYMYYNFENKGNWYKTIWRISNLGRYLISILPNPVKKSTADLLALMIYWPLARVYLLSSRLGMKISDFPLKQYADKSLYVMRNDCLDRFGTRLEKRFSQSEIKSILIVAGADPESIVFSSEEPFWCFTAVKA